MDKPSGPSYDEIGAILRSPMNKMLRLNNMLGVPTIQTSVDGKLVSMRGITKPLKRCFYPSYEYTGPDSARRAAERAEEAGYGPPLPHDKRRRACATRRKVRGCDLGNTVDYHLRLYANNKTAFGRLGTHLHATARDLITAYNLWGWTCVVSQFPIAAPDLSIGTRLDMLARDKEGRAVLIENKTGFDAYLLKSTGKMKAPLGDIDNCPLNQHFLQLLHEALILDKYWGVDLYANSYVVQATPDGVTPYRLPEWIIARKEDIWLAFAAYALRTVGERGARKRARQPSDCSTASKRRRISPSPFPSKMSQ